MKVVTVVVAEKYEEQLRISFGTQKNAIGYR